MSFINTTYIRLFPFLSVFFCFFLVRVDICCICAWAIYVCKIYVLGGSYMILFMHEYVQKIMRKRHTNALTMRIIVKVKRSMAPCRIYIFRCWSSKLFWIIWMFCRIINMNGKILLDLNEACTFGLLCCFRVRPETKRYWIA